MRAPDRSSLATKKSRTPPNVVCAAPGVTGKPPLLEPLTMTSWWASTPIPNPPPRVAVRAAEVGRPGDASGPIELGHVAVEHRRVGAGLQRAARRRELGGASEAGEVGAAIVIDRDAVADVIAAAAKVRRVDEPRAIRTELRGERVHRHVLERPRPAAEGRVERAARGREVRRTGEAGDDDAAVLGQRQRVRAVVSRAAEVRRVEQPRAVGAQWGDERVPEQPVAALAYAVERRVERPVRRREPGGREA